MANWSESFDPPIGNWEAVGGGSFVIEADGGIDGNCLKVTGSGAFSGANAEFGTVDCPTQSGDPDMAFEVRVVNVRSPNHDSWFGIMDDSLQNGYLCRFPGNTGASEYKFFSVTGGVLTEETSWFNGVGGTDEWHGGGGTSRFVGQISWDDDDSELQVFIRSGTNTKTDPYTGPTHSNLTRFLFSANGETWTDDIIVYNVEPLPPDSADATVRVDGANSAHHIDIQANSAAHSLLAAGAPVSVSGDSGVLIAGVRYDLPATPAPGSQLLCTTESPPTVSLESLGGTDHPELVTGGPDGA